MGADIHVYTGIIAKIELILRPYTIVVNSCPNKGCENHNKELNVKFCSSCGNNVSELVVKKYGIRTWDDFMRSREYDGEDVLSQSCDYHDDVDGYQILTSYEYGSEGIDLDPQVGNVVTIEELQADCTRIMTKFESENRELIRAADEFFDDNFSYYYGVCSHWSC